MIESHGLLTDSGEPFATGASEYFDAFPGRKEPNARIYVQFQPEGSPFEFMALLDTGAHYCILNQEAAQVTRPYLTGGLGDVELRTAYGLVRGELFLHRIQFLAEIGEPVDIDAIVFVPPGWQEPCFLGYTGVLERMRFAVDPVRNLFFFGPLG